MFALREVKTAEDRYSVLAEVFAHTASSHSSVYSDLETAFQQVDFNAKEHLVTPGKKCSHLYLICSGTAYGYYPSEHEEKLVALAYQRDLVTGLGSFNTNQPATFGIKAYSDVQALSISYSELRELLNKHRPLEQWFLRAAFSIIAGMEIRLASTAMPAEERFERLMQSSPHVFNLFPQRLIASYLNMTPETLSRLRKQHARSS